jgi:CHAD domain-containing protein
MTTASLEVERKYDVPPTAAVPDLSGLPGVDRLAAPVTHTLQATYFDTADLRLRSAGVTLRRRRGGDDAGWHLKLPAGADREEIRVAKVGGADTAPDVVASPDSGEAPDIGESGGPDDGPPAALLALVRARVRDQRLAPVAELSTTRTVHRLLAADGTPLAELADDVVSGQPLPDGSGPPLSWREWEVELLQGDRSLLDDAQRVLLEAGATGSRSASKVGRVLSRRQQARDVRQWWAERPGTVHAPTAAAAVQQHLAEQVQELVERDPQVRRDLPDAVHKMRVATRRLRSALATFRPLLDRERTDPLRDELKWLAGVLGAARDAEVMHARLQRLVAAEPPELVLGRVVHRIDAAMGGRYRTAHERVLCELDGERYLQLLDALDRLVEAPPFSDRAREPAADVLPAMVRRTWRRLHRAMAAADRAAPGAAKEELLHEVRKDAKRARYAAEAVTPVVGTPAKRFAAAMEDLQETLGDHRDGVVTREVLRELGARGHLAGENGFTYGRLHALEQVRGEAAVARFPAARKACSRRRLRRWFED